jgi:hypothetical protein
MKYAVNRWTSRTVDADEASHGDSFRCPVCSAAVTLRAGGERTAYFAHKPGAGTKDCELYHLGTLSNAGYLDSGSQNTNWEMVLNVTLAKVGFPRAWGLELLVPFKEGCQGELDIDVGGRTQTVKLTDARKEKRVTAEPQAAAYTIVSSRIADRWRDSTLIRSCDGLSATKATAFGEASRSDGKLIPRTHILRRGGRYIFIWDEALSPVFPDELIVERLSDSANWRAASVDIPDAVSAECAAWIFNFCDLGLAEKSPAFIPSWPPLVSNIGVQLAEAPQGSVLYMGFVGLPEKLKRRAIFYARSGARDVALSIEPAATPFVKVSTEGESVFQVSCRDASDLRLELDCALEIDKLGQLPGVILVGSASDGTVSTAQLHDQGSADWLERVSKGDLLLTELIAPSYCTGVIRTARCSAWQTIVELTVRSSDAPTNGSLPWNRFVPVIAKILSDRSVDIQIDFGPLGRAWIPARHRAQDDGIFPLSSVLRGRLLSYLGQMPRSANSVPVNLAGTDRELIDAAFASQPLPATLSFHRALLKELKPLMPKGKV